MTPDEGSDPVRRSPVCRRNTAPSVYGFDTTGTRSGMEPVPADPLTTDHLAGGLGRAPGYDGDAGPSRPHQLLALGAFVAPVVIAAAIGARVGPSRAGPARWYARLAKPPFQPPPEVFAPVWTALYATIAVSGWRVWRRPSSPERTMALGLWATQMVANGAWSPTFFGARRPRAALGVLAAQLASTAGYTAVASRVDAPAAALMGPYLGWTAFAGALNEEIVRRNPGA